MEAKIELYESGQEQYPKSRIALANLFMVLWIAVGTVGCRLYSSWAAGLYLALAVVMIYAVLRKLLCTNCYYYGKWCGVGWGKLSAVFCQKGDIKEFRKSIGVKIAPITYGLLSLIPIIFIAISMMREFHVSQAVVLALLLIISFYSGTVSRKKTCAECKMKLICPGSAVSS